MVLQIKFQHDGAIRDDADYVSTFNGRSGEVIPENGDYTAASITNTPAGDIAATNVQAAINELDSEKAAIDDLRERLTGNLTIYVRTDGSDANDGLTDTAGGAFLTLQAAYVAVASRYDLANTYMVKIKVADGTYTAGLNLYGPLVGQLSPNHFVIEGNTSDRNAVIIAPSSGACFTAAYGAAAKLRYLKLDGSGTAQDCEQLGQYANIVHEELHWVCSGTPPYGHITATLHCTLVFSQGEYEISGNGQCFLFCSQNTNCYWNTDGIPGLIDVTLNGTPAFSDSFIRAQDSTTLNVQAITWTGSATGRRFVVTGNGTIDVGPDSRTTFPGDVAGVELTGGLYLSTANKGRQVIPRGTNAFPTLTFWDSGYTLDDDTGIYSTGANTINLAIGGVNAYSFDGTGFGINTGQGIYNRNGSATVPSWAFISDAQTGMYRVGAGVLGFTLAGTRAASIHPGGVAALSAGAVPSGRLTLTSGTPVGVAEVANATAIYYTPYLGNLIYLYDGTVWIPHQFTELTNTTTDNTKNPAAVANNSNYDLFVWTDSGTLRLSRGPAWTSGTGRGSGAGTTELARVGGVLMNAVAITNGPAASRGVYVGTVQSNGSATIDWQIGGSASGGDPAILNLWNMYNRRPFAVRVQENDNSWSHNGAFRALNNSNNNRVSFVRGVDEDAVTAQYTGAVNPAAANNAGYGIGVDSTSASTGNDALSNNAVIIAVTASYRGLPGLGAHYLQALEFSSASSTFYGDNSGASGFKSALQVELFA